MTDTPPRRYNLDTDTEELVETVLNIVTQVAELQYDEAAQEALYVIAETLADRFDIQRTEVEVSEGEDEDGNPVTVIRTEPQRSKPRLNIIQGGRLDDTPADDDDTKH